MAPRRGVLFPHLCEMIFRESLGHADKGGPKSAMNQSHFPSDQPAYEDIA